MWGNMKNILVFVLLLMPAAAAAYTVQGNLTVTGSASIAGGVTASTVTASSATLSSLSVPSGNFSVGGSTFTVKAGQVIISSTGTATATSAALQVVGNAMLSQNGITINDTAGNPASRNWNISGAGSTYGTFSFAVSNSSFTDPSTNGNIAVLISTGGSTEFGTPSNSGGNVTEISGNGSKNTLIINGSTATFVLTSGSNSTGILIIHDSTSGYGALVYFDYNNFLAIIQQSSGSQYSTTQTSGKLYLTYNSGTSTLSVCNDQIGSTQTVFMTVLSSQL